ncbi:hypothetical protein D5125_02860 [Magnetovirga frankeli]|uniref:hypothetical protein n=1 Tax=Magnetovirga frankeli TaxID=947516 RepID=UPI001293E47A|nr:hypothetical protein D5125_02860 [gamma proteobacterium SS-5]
MSGPTKAELEARLRHYEAQQQRKREQSKARREKRKKGGEQELRLYVPKDKLAACRTAVEQVVQGTGYPSVVEPAGTEAIPLVDLIRQMGMMMVEVALRIEAEGSREEKEKLGCPVWRAWHPLRRSLGFLGIQEKACKPSVSDGKGASNSAEQKSDPPQEPGEAPEPTPPAEPVQ